MVISPNRNAHRLSHAFVEAARLLGPARQHSYNGGAYEGAWIAELAHRDGRRFSAYDAYLKPALRRPNLTVMKDAQVLRADIENGRTLGVTLRRGGADHAITARGVVLAAGAIGSPQLLMLSGVGPPETLARLGIAVQRDAPEVGENLQDHPMSAVSFRVRGTDTLRSAASLPSLLRYLLFRRGMLASNAVEAIAFAR